MTDKKVVHHIDTYYYSVSIEGDYPGNEDDNVKYMIGAFDALKEEKLSEREKIVEAFGLQIEPFMFSIYQYHLTEPENYDIFIAKNIQNESTPRFCVQLRSRMLVLEGVDKAIEKSFNKLKEIARFFEFNLSSVCENRIDYAYHTNLIQKSMDYLTTEYLSNHLKTKLRTFSFHGDVNDGLETNTLWLGTRKSNNIFFRWYNKSKEVIQQNYKSFFFERWYEKKLINKYDLYVYRRAFELKSWVTGVLVARCEWYIQYGSDNNIKDDLKKLIKQCYINSDNSRQLTKKVKGLLPEITIVNNIEFQTKRAFYVSFGKSISEHYFNFKGDPLLQRLYKIIYMRREFLDYLTTQAVSIVDNKGKCNERITDWWNRIHRCKIEYSDPSILELYREHDINASLQQSKRQVLNSVARYVSILNNCESDCRDFNEDIRDALSTLNDNDIHRASEMIKRGELPSLVNYQYSDIQKRVHRKLKPIIKKEKEKEEKEK